MRIDVNDVQAIADAFIYAAPNDCHGDARVVNKGEWAFLSETHEMHAHA